MKLKEEPGGPVCMNSEDINHDNIFKFISFHSHKNKYNPGHMQHVIACAKDFQKKREEVLKDIAGGQG